jgi:hypothetical protein
MINLVFADAGPLISLAQANALDLLLKFAPEVEIIITDLVCHEVTTNKEVYIDAAKISQFLTKHAGHVMVENTSYGQYIIAASTSDPNFKMPDDAGEISIISIDQFRKEPSLIIFEDRWFIDRLERLQKNTNLVSTSVFLKVALQKEIISKQRYDEIINAMMFSGRNLEEVENNTEWESSFGIK